MTAGYGAKVAKPGFVYISFFKKRLIRLYPLHLLSLLVLMPGILCALISHHEIHYGIAAYLTADLLLLQSWIPKGEAYFFGNPVSWFLSDMLFFYVLFPIVIRIANKLSKSSRYLLFLSMFGCYFMFGFTFMIWQHFYKHLKQTGYCPDLSKGVLIHGGGWKKLVSESVSPEEYKKKLNEVCGIPVGNIHDYYGMVEQTGSIYMECECGHLHAPAFSDVLVRRPIDFSLADMGERGIIEVVSVLPGSYPGHAEPSPHEQQLFYKLSRYGDAHIFGRQYPTR